MLPSRLKPHVADVGGVAIPRARTQADALQSVRRVPAALVPTLRTAVPQLPEHVAFRVRAEIPAFAGAGHDRLHRLVRDAVAVAIDGFLRLAAGDEDCRIGVDAHFRGLGRAEAEAGVGVHRVLAAIHVASDTVWQAIHTLVAREELSGAAVADLGMAVTRYLTHLATAVQQGYADVRQTRADARAMLLRALMHEPSAVHPDAITELAAAGRWRPPERVMVVVAQRYGSVLPQPFGVAADALVGTDGDRLVVVTVEARADEVTRTLLRLGPRVLVAQSWSVPLLESRHAYRWASRALALARKGELRADGRVVVCARHRMALWLAADRPLADDMAEKLLAPLMVEKRHNRLMLAETMLRWLETAESAPAMAAHLRTHPQTIRNRMHKLRELFATCLDDAEQRLALIVALHAVLPSWHEEQRRQRRRRLR